MELTICRAIEVLSGDFSNIEFAEGESHSDAFAEAFRMAVASLKQKRDYATRFSADDYQVLAERTMTKWEELKRFGCVYLVDRKHFSIVAYRDIFGIGIAISHGTLDIQFGYLEFTWY